jgi:DNA-binding NtrC family response regulator
VRTLIAWIGDHDIAAPSNDNSEHVGPIARALRGRSFDAARLLYVDRTLEEVERYRSWLQQFTAAELTLEQMDLSSPMNMSEIHHAAVRALTDVSERGPLRPELWFHLSAGTSAMVAVWILLGKTRFRGRFLQTSPQAGVETVDIPFDIAADFLPGVLVDADKRLADRSSAAPPDESRFGDILYRSEEMQQVVQLAKKAVPWRYPILIVGESGTGKELLAKAIVNDAKEKGIRTGPLVSLNCGAIPREMVESELFGHVEGAFTGARKKRDGVFKQADGGTLFLDEIGELPLDQQVKLLRVLQDYSFTPLGDTKAIKVDVRVIAATNRNLWEGVAKGTFRDDLLFRLDVMTIHVPRLRDRGGDLHYLIDALMKQVNAECEEDLQYLPTASGAPRYTRKILNAAAINVLGQRQWRGNIRELHNTLRRAAAYADEDTISEAALRVALPTEFGEPKRAEHELLPSLGDGIDLPEVISNVAAHYLKQAMTAAGGNKARANRLVQVGTPTTFASWYGKYVKPG